jgi:phage terminase small subunit
MRRLKPRQERFCRYFAECANAAQAARAAGYQPGCSRNAGYRLLRQPRIAARIAEIQSETAEAHCRDVNVLLGKLETVYRRAIDGHHFSAAARAVELQAKLAGVGLVRRTLKPERLTSDHPASADADAESKDEPA